MFDSLAAQPIKTRVLHRGEMLLDFIVEQVPPKNIQERMILAISSKIVSLCENRVVEKSKISKVELIDQEADHNFGEVGYGCFITIKHGLFIASAGIDESNSEDGHYILYPKDPFGSARDLWQSLRDRWKIEDLGILFTDSRTSPLRKGVTGVALAHWGFSGLQDMVDQPDLFGRHMKMTMINVADALASVATLMMGETNECRPLAILNCEGIEFNKTTAKDELAVPLKEDLYSPLIIKSKLQS